MPFWSHVLELKIQNSKLFGGSMLWPMSLILLGLIPLLIGLYIWVLRRRRRYAVRFSSLGLVLSLIHI